jgi:uracil-DNA glycosylase family 4
LAVHERWLRYQLELARMMGVDTLPARPALTRQSRLDRVEQEVRRCTRCRLHKTRTQGVFARGNPHARLMFVGEAPGAEEDRQGVPFVGPAGKLLDAMIHAMGLRQDQVYITNILKSRPPGNRDPRADEVAACAPFLEEQIEVVDPAVLCTLGRPASNALLGTNSAMGALRGRWHRYRGIPLLPTYHPAYLLRSPAQKSKAWEDLKMLIAALE